MRSIKGKLYAGFAVVLLLFSLLAGASYIGLLEFAQVRDEISDQTRVVNKSVEFSRSVDALTAAVLRFALSRAKEDLASLTLSAEDVRGRGETLVREFANREDMPSEDRVLKTLAGMDQLLPIVFKRLETETETAELTFYGANSLRTSIDRFTRVVALGPSHNASDVSSAMRGVAEEFTYSAFKYLDSHSEKDLAEFRGHGARLDDAVQFARSALAGTHPVVARLLDDIVRDADIVKNGAYQLEGALAGYRESMDRFYRFAEDARTLAQDVRSAEEGRQARVLEDFSARIDATLTIGLLIDLVAVLAAILVASALARNIVRPLKSMTVAMNRLAEGGLQVGLPETKRSDELGDMARSVKVFRDNAQEMARLQEVQAESDRRETQNRAWFQAVVNNAPGSISLKDPYGRFLLVNKKYEDLTGERASEIIGKTVAEVYNEGFAIDRMALDSEVLGTGDTIVKEEDFGPAGPSGRRGHYLTTKFPVFGEDGSVVAVGTLRTDISEQKETERALEEAKARAEAANASKDMFLANVSHELRTPLAAIIGYSKLMTSGVVGQDDPEQAKQFAERIHGSAEHLLSLINDILDVSVLAVGAVKLDETDVDLVDLVRGSVDMVLPRAAEKDLDIAVELPEGPFGLRADARFLRQILVNLLTNSIKFTPDGGKIVISGAVEPSGGVVLGVRDTGIGVKPEDMERILEPFGQAQTDLSRRREGTGIGLTLSKQLTESHDGMFSIESAYGEGTTVTCRFPPERTLFPLSAE